MHTHVAPTYLSESVERTGVVNVVSAVLADYRGYDTLGETVVIFTAGIGVIALLKGTRRTPPAPAPDGPQTRAGATTRRDDENDEAAS